MTEQESRPRREYRHRPSFVWPIILIAVGVVFLLSNLGLVDKDIWQNFWKLWPLIFIAIGLDSLFRRNEIAGPVFMIGLGTIILLSSVGLIGWRTWDILWRLWPVLLVAIGLEILFRRRSLWVSALVVFGILAILGGALWIYGGAPLRGQELIGVQVNQVLGDIAQAEIDISPVAGDLTVGRLIDSNDLVSGEVSAGKTGQAYTEYEVVGTTGKFKIDSWSMVDFPGTRPRNWDLSLTDQIPLKLEIRIGAGQLTADLAGLTLTGLDINQGVGDVTVTLSDGADYSASLHQAVGSIVVTVPKSAGVRLEINRAITALSIPPVFERRGDYYYSPGFDQSDFQIDLEISQAVGSIVVQFE
jgi:hypothetical protein